MRHLQLTDDSQGQVCDIQLAGNYNIARKIADKLVPLKSRGRLLQPPVSLIDAMNCCERLAYEYENLIVTTSWGIGPPAVRYIFKSRECAVKQPPIRPLDRYSPGIITPPPPLGRGELNSGNGNRIYRKYETTQPAVIIYLPVPELTPEAVARPALGEMIIEAVLMSSGEVDNIVLRGSLKNGMVARAVAAMRKIKFKPALLGGSPVSQRILIKYSVKKCDWGRICTRAVEILDLP
ncbi:MAG: energy transducer TonB [Acidobacteria bacterium]|nr:energy transducer TonB [Acidobacteriota bacterium]